MKFLNTCRAAIVCIGLMFASLAFPYSVRVGPLICTFKEGTWHVQVAGDATQSALTIALGANPVPIVVGPTGLLIPFQVTAGTGQFVGVEIQATPNPAPVATGQEQPGTDLHGTQLGQHLVDNPNVPDLTDNNGGLPFFTLLNLMVQAIIDSATTIAGGTQADTPHPAPATLPLNGDQAPLGNDQGMSVASNNDVLTVQHHTDNHNESPNDLVTVTATGLNAQQYSRARVWIQTQNAKGTYGGYYLQRLKSCDIWRDGYDAARDWCSGIGSWRPWGGKPKQKAPLYVEVVGAKAALRVKHGIEAQVMKYHLKALSGGLVDDPKSGEAITIDLKDLSIPASRYMP